MNAEYDKFLKRMIEYRTKMNMTQEEVSKEVGITQSQYSKMELGKTIFPYEIICALNDMNWDMDNLLIGSYSGEIKQELLQLLQFRDEKYWKEFLQIIMWSLKLGIRKSKIPVDYEIQCEMGILNLQITEERENTLLFEIRSILNISQIMMSERLGVNIKKYRMLEKEIIYPDAELLLRIYEVTGCQPSIFLSEENLEKKVLNSLWDKISPEFQKEVQKYLEITAHLLDE